jgi:hypothetical protein
MAGSFRWTKEYHWLSRLVVYKMVAVTEKFASGEDT